MKYVIIPTVFSYKKKEFDERLNKLIKISKAVQIDLMDGKFVKAKSLSVSQIPSLKRYKNNFEGHLMVKKPSKYLTQLKNKGFKKIIFHFNTDDNVKTIAKIKKLHMQAFLALNPEDKIKDVCYLFQLLDGVLVMGVHPGKEHQSLIASTIKKIKSIRGIDRSIDIQVDGGVNPSTIKKLRKAGANIFNTGSFVSDAENLKVALGQLNKAINQFLVA